MESSKRIIVVLSTILFLEASAFDSTFQQAPNNYGNNQQTRGPQNTFLSNGSPSTLQSTGYLGHQALTTNLVSNSLRKSSQGYMNSGSNFGSVSNNMGSANTGQGSHNIGGLNIAQKSNQFGGLNIAQRQQQFANIGPGPIQLSGTNIGQVSRLGGGDIAQGANQIGGSSIGLGANRIGGLGFGQDYLPNHFVVQNSGQQSNQLSDLNIRQGHLGGFNIGQDLSRHISSLNIGEGTHQFGGLNIAPGSSSISASSIAQNFNQFGGGNIGQVSNHNQFSGSNVAQVASQTGGSGIGQRTNIVSSNVAHESTGNVAGLNSAHLLQFQSAFNRKPNSQYMFPHNTGSNTGYGSSLNIGINSDSSLNTGTNNVAGTTFTDAGSNRVPKITEISGSKSVYGSNLNNGLRREFGSNLNTRPSLTSVYPLEQIYTMLSQPQRATNAQFTQNYDSVMNNPTTTGSYPKPSHVVGYTADGDDKFKIVHVPIKSGSQSIQTLRLPIPENVKNKVLHVNPNETSLPSNITKTVEGEEFSIQKALEMNESNKIGNNQVNAAQTTVPNIARVTENQNRDKPSITYYNYDSNKNIPNTLINTLTQANQELKEITSTAPGNSFGNLNNNRYPATDKLINYNQHSSSNQAATSSSLSNVQDVTNIYDINFGKNTNPNYVMNTLINAELNLNEVLKANKNFTDSKQGSQTTSTIPTTTTSPTETRGQFSNLYNSGYQYPPTNQYNRLPYDSSRKYYPETNTWQTYKQPEGYESLAPFAITQSGASATASSSTSQNRPNLYGNYNNPNYYNSRPGDLTGINRPQSTFSLSQNNAPYLNIGSAQPQYHADGSYTNIDPLNRFKQVENLPSQQLTTKTAQPPEVDVLKSNTIIKNVFSSSNYDLNNNNYALLGNYPDSTPDLYLQPTDFGMNYATNDVPPSYKTSGTQKSSADTTNQGTPIDNSYLLNANNDTQPFDDANYANGDSVSPNFVSTATAVATSDVSQSGNVISALALNVFDQNYENPLFNIQPTDDTIINNPTGTGNENDSKSSYSQTSSASTTYNIESSDEYADSNTNTETDSFNRASDNTKQNQSFVDNTTDIVQDSMEYGNDDKVTSTASSSNTVVSESTTTATDSESQDISYYNSPLYYQSSKSHRHRHQYENNHPRYHRLNWNEYGDPSKFIDPHSRNYPDYNDAVNHQLSSTENEEVYYSEISRESALATDSESLYNVGDKTKIQAFTDGKSDETRQTVINKNHDVISDTNGQSSDGYSLNNQIIGKEKRTNPSIVIATADINYNAEYSDGKGQDFESEKLIQLDKSTKKTNKQDLEVDNEQTTKVKSSVYDNNRTRLAKLGTILNTRPDGTSYSCALDVLMKIVDAIERMLTSEDNL